MSGHPRQINCTAARQGGFSTRVLPAAREYNLDPLPNVVYCDGTTLQLSTSSNATLLVPTAQTPLWQTSGGPFDEPYILGSASTAASAYILTLNNLAPESGPFTLEAWYKAETSGASQAVISQLIGGVDNAEISGTFVRGTPHLSFTYTLGGVGIARERESVVNQWRHLALVRDSSSIRAYDAGNRITTVVGGTEPEDPLIFQAAATIQGRASISLGQMRFTPGQAIYSGDTITVPTEPFIAL